MRLRTSLTLASSPLLLLPLWLPLGLAAPPNLQAPSPVPESTTLIDGLSSDPDFTLFLQLVQRAKLVPTLNKLNGSTLFAPTNDAIRKYTDKHPSSVWAQAVDWARFERTPGRGFIADRTYDDDHFSSSDDDDDDARMAVFDNVQEGLRQHIFYHLLNYTLVDFPPASDAPTPQALQTLHFPHKPSEPPSKEPPPASPWLPTPGGLLGGEPQRLRIATVPSSFGSEEEDDDSKDKAWKRLVGVDDHARGGAQVVKNPIVTGNGNIFPINRVLVLPRDLQWQVEHHPLLSTFAKYIPPHVKDALLNAAPHLTLFFPVNAAWDALDPIERRYLESGFAQNDVEKIVGLHASGSGVRADDDDRKVGWSEYWSRDALTNITTIQGHTLRVNATTQSVSGRAILEKDIYASNGVLHVVSELLLHPDIFKLNAEKYLLALNATSFVSLLRAANMSHYVDDEHDGKAWTILAPQDDVFTQDPAARWTLDGLAAPLLSGFVRGDHNDSAAIEQVLKYHIIPGKLTPQDLEDGSLLGTELREAGLGGGRQKLPVVVDTPPGGSKFGRWTGNGHISFGGATVIHDAVEIGDTVIYVISKVLEPPPDVIEAALPSSHLSTFLTSVFASKLDDELKKEPLTTLLIPHNSAWNPLGLLTNYLLLPEARKDLENVVKHHVLKEVVYSSDGSLSSSIIAGGGGVSRTYQTMEGSDLRIDSGRVISSGGWSADLSIHVVPGDILTQTGVVHELKGNGVLIPRSVNVNVGDLAKAGKGSIMLGLVQKAGYGGVLNGTLKLDLDEWLDRGWTDAAGNARKSKKQEVGWTLLCPNDDAFRGLNLTQMLEDREGLTRFVRQHIIPVAPAKLSAILAREAEQRKKRADTKRKKQPVQDELLEENPNRPIPIFDDASYATLLTPSSLRGDIVFKATGSNPDSFLVGIRGASGPKGESESARILNWGRTTTSSTSKRKDEPTSDDGTQTPLSLPPLVDVMESETSLRSGVIVIDRPLYPYVPTWWVAWGQAAATGAVGSLVILSSFAALLLWWRRKGSEATYEPIGGQEDD